MLHGRDVSVHPPPNCIRRPQNCHTSCTIPRGISLDGGALAALCPATESVGVAGIQDRAMLGLRPIGAPIGSRLAEEMVGG